MCETGDNNMTFTTVDQKIACEYIEAYTCNFLLYKWLKSCSCDQFHTYSKWFASKI